MSDIPQDEWKKLQNFFIDVVERRVKQMEEAVKLGDLDLVKLYAHQLKGSGDSYGFHEITEISFQIEQKCSENSYDNIIELIQKLRKAVENLKQKPYLE